MFEEVDSECVIQEVRRATPSAFGTRRVSGYTEGVHACTICTLSQGAFCVVVREIVARSGSALKLFSSGALSMTLQIGGVGRLELNRKLLSALCCD